MEFNNFYFRINFEAVKVPQLIIKGIMRTYANLLEYFST